MVFFPNHSIPSNYKLFVLPKIKWCVCVILITFCATFLLQFSSLPMMKALIILRSHPMVLSSSSAAALAPSHSSHNSDPPTSFL